MKKACFCFALMLAILQNIQVKAQSDKPNSLTDDYLNFYLIAWYGNYRDHLAYARNMGHSHVYYKAGMEKDSLSKNMKFYIGAPEYHFYKREVDTRKEYSDEEKEFLSKFAALKDSSASFPNNLARAWFKTPNIFCIEPDYQQQKVIDYLVNHTLQWIDTLEDNEFNFKFAGFLWDVPQLTGDFWDTIQTYQGINLGSQITLKYWTGRDAGSLYPGTYHNYPTYSDGKAAYYKQLFTRVREKYPNMKVFMEPYKIYESYISQIEQRPDFKELLPDILAQEKAGIEFITDKRIYKNNLIDKKNVLSTTPDVYNEKTLREIAGESAYDGRYFGWYGRWGGTGDAPNYQNIWEVPPRLLLIRAIPVWENLNETPVVMRKWDKEVYSSPTAYFSKELIMGVHPETKAVYIVFNNPEAIVQLPSWFSHDVLVYRTNGILEQEKSICNDLSISNKTVSLKNRSYTGKCFILKQK